MGRGKEGLEGEKWLRHYIITQLGKSQLILERLNVVVLLLPLQWEARLCHLQILMCDLQMVLQKHTLMLFVFLYSPCQLCHYLL